MEGKYAILCLSILGADRNSDGLVAARHLRHFGMIPQILYPKKGKTDLFDDLITQCKSIDIKIFDELPQEEFGRFDLIVDALFGEFQIC